MSVRRWEGLMTRGQIFKERHRVCEVRRAIDEAKQNCGCGKIELQPENIRVRRFKVHEPYNRSACVAAGTDFPSGMEMKLWRRKDHTKTEASGGASYMVSRLTDRELSTQAYGEKLALINTPEFGDIFAFTDAIAKDGELMESDIAIGENTQISVTIVYSGPLKESDERYSLTDIEDYQYLADVTGGLFIPADEFSVEAIVPILGEGVESATVDITLLKNQTGYQYIDVPIDDSIFDFDIQITGVTTIALLKDINGKEYDLKNEASLDAEPNVEVIVFTESFIVVRWKDPLFGIWNLQLDSVDTYGVTISANSTLGWLGGFSVLDTKPPHPHYKEAEGRPVINTIYYLDVILIGYIESYVVDVSHVEYVDL
ncbi:hypothetical protein SK128_004439, partial [Halocaridina rubra]